MSISHPLCRKLRQIKRDELQRHGRSLKWFVANHILKEGGYSDDDLALYFSDLLHHGCVSGFVGPLIYYRDTYRFFDRFYHEIEELRQDMEESLGEPVRIRGDLKNELAWFGFEETAYRIYTQELGQEW